MPALIKYERKPLTRAQLYAVRGYIARKRLKELQSSTNGEMYPSESDPKREEDDNGCISEPDVPPTGPSTPPAPSPEEIRLEKERSLKKISEQLAELEHTLEGLKQKKHELFEEFKSLVSKENQNKKLAEEKERQSHGLPSPYMAQAAGQGVTMNMSPYRPLGMGGIKRPKSPSPPLVQLYSPNRPTSNLQPSYDMPHSSPALTRPHHPAPHAMLGQGEVPRSPYQPMGNRVSGHPDNMLPGYQYQQNFSPRDPRQQVHGSQVNPHLPSSPQAPGSHYASHERQFMEQSFHHDRHLPSFGNPQASGPGMSGNPGHGMGLQNLPRQPLMNQSPFLQQNTIPGQQAASNIQDGLGGFSSFGKDRPGFSNPGLHRPQVQMKRGSHLPSRSSRYY